MAGPTALVTGAGRGIGRATVDALAARGWTVVAGVRDPERALAEHGRPEGVVLVALDVTDAAAVSAAVAQAEGLAGGALGCLVNNAGYAVLGAVEEVDIAETRAMFETNVIGALAVTQAVLPAMRRAGSGVIVNVSSIGARITNPLLGAYHASKYALASLTEALAIEVRPFGIRVVAIEPGMVDTDFPRATRPTGAASRGEGPYADLLDGLRVSFAGWRARHAVTAAAVAEAIVAAIEDPATPLRVPVGDDAVELAGLRAGGDDAAYQEGLLRFLDLRWPPS